MNDPVVEEATDAPEVTPEAEELTPEQQEQLKLIELFREAHDTAYARMAKRHRYAYYILVLTGGSITEAAGLMKTDPRTLYRYKREALRFMERESMAELARLQAAEAEKESAEDVEG